MKFASVCSGIEAASVAWHGLGWQASWLSEIEPFPCALLAQRFQDNWTQIEWRGKDAQDCPDSHRYKAIGNSMAVPVMRWIGERIKGELC